MRALVTGATGFIGRRLVSKLEGPVVLSRDPRSGVPWNPVAGPPPAEAFRDVQVVFHLAGDPVAEGRWTAEKKERIRQSRVLGTRHLVQAIESLSVRPRVLVSASAVGVYGDRGDEVLDESAAPGADFLAEVCRAWEAEACRARDLGVRVVTIRTGIVLGKGGALAKMLLPFRIGLGGRLGSGTQWMPWIHIDDEIGLLLHAAERDEVAGPMNASAPEPVSNLEFARTLGRVLRRPAILPAPRAALGLAFGAEKAAMLLGSQRAVPRAAERTGYRFRFSQIEPALRAVVDELQAVGTSPT